MRAGCRVHVAAVLSESERDGSHPFLDRLRDEGIPVFSIIARSKAFLRERAGLATLIGSHPVDIVHTHGDRPDVVDGGVARRLGCASVSTVHGFTRGSGPVQRLYEHVHLIALRRFDAVVAVSSPLATELESAGISRDRVHTVSNAWAGDAPFERKRARQELGIDEGERLIGWVGRLSSEKAPESLLRALPLLEDEAVAVGFIGDGPLQPQLETRAVELGIGSRVRWFGRIPNAGRLLAAFDVLALTSLTEGTPMVLLEAMAAGVPIVATQVGGVPDVLQEGAGLLVPPGDSEALARALGRVLRDAGQADEVRKAGQRRLESAYTPDTWVERYGAVYHAALAQRRARSPHAGQGS
jgi:glycosyltransferase involved in cell wall biosynthesis